MYVLWIAGGRKGEFQPYHVVLLHNLDPLPDKLVVGSQAGIDGEATRWARSWGIPVQTVYAQWDVYGRSAGPRRNQELAKLASALIAFPGGRGTESAIRCAREAGIPVYFPCAQAIKTLNSTHKPPGAGTSQGTPVVTSATSDDVAPDTVMAHPEPAQPPVARPHEQFLRS